MIKFLVHHYASLPGSQNPLLGPGLKSFHWRLYLSTDYKRTGAIFRGHVNYCSTGPWYNWVMLRWAREDNQRFSGDSDCKAAYGDNEATAIENLYAPGKILGFVDATPIDWNRETKLALLGEVMAVVSTCGFSHTRESVF
jgi:hypothetical protein